MTIVLIPGLAWKYAEGQITPLAVRHFYEGKGSIYAIAVDLEDADKLLRFYKEQLKSITFSKVRSGLRVTRGQYKALQKASWRLQTAIRELSE